MLARVWRWLGNWIWSRAPKFSRITASPSEDGEAIQLCLFAAEEAQHERELILSTEAAHALIEQLQRAVSAAQEIRQGSSPDGRVFFRYPNTVEIQALPEGPMLVFDRGEGSELAYVLPPAQLALLREGLRIVVAAAPPETRRH